MALHDPTPNNGGGGDGMTPHQVYRVSLIAAGMHLDSLGGASTALNFSQQVLGAIEKVNLDAGAFLCEDCIRVATAHTLIVSAAAFFCDLEQDFRSSNIPLNGRELAEGAVVELLEAFDRIKERETKNAG